MKEHLYEIICVTLVVYIAGMVGVIISLSVN